MFFVVLHRSSDNTDEDLEPLLENEGEAVEHHEAVAIDDHDADAHPKNINVRAAFIHVLGDIIQSIGVLISSLIIKLKVSGFVAPLLTLSQTTNFRLFQTERFCRQQF